MQDNLEKFISKHKNEFDDLSPNEMVWEGINQKLNADKSTTNHLRIWKAAAVILLVFSVGLTMFVNRDLFSTSDDVVAYDNEFLSTEKFYASEINERQNLIKEVARTYPDIEQDFEQDWAGLDMEYRSLKKEYEKNQNEEIRNAMVQNLRSRVDLLNKQLRVLENIESKEDNIIEI